MRTVQRAFLYVISLVLIAAGAAVAAYPFNQQIAELAVKLSENWMLCLLVGCVAAALGVVTLVPFDLFGRKGRSISFAGPTGTVSIQIEPFESSLRKTIAKLPMVKRVSVSVTPKDNDRKVGIEASVSLKKPAESSTRETAERLREFIDKVSRQILGADEVMTVDVRIEDVLIDPSQTAESLNGIFAAAEKTVAPVARTVAPAAVVAAAAPVAAPVTQEATEEVAPAEDDRPELSSIQDDEGTDAAAPHSSDLLTYDEAQERDHVRFSEHDAAPVADAAEEGPAESTSFATLADVQDSEKPEDAPGDKA